MHLVFVTSLVPVARPSSGFDIANRVIVDALRALGHRVSVLGFLQPGQEATQPEDTHILGRLEVTNARVGPGRKLAWIASAILRNEPVSVAKMHAASRAAVARALGSLAPFDALILNSVQLPGAFLELLSDWPFAFVAHNVEARSAAANAVTAASAADRILFRREARLLRRLEKHLCERAAFVFTLADEDRAALGVDAPDRSASLPLVTSLEAAVSSQPRNAVHDLGLIGSWSWAANRVGLDWFLNEVVPLLPKDFDIAVAGAIDRPGAVPENVRLLGRVEDAQAFIRSARVVPLISRTGTGVQLKTIETFELGMPSVATRNALRGVAAHPDGCIVADDAESFAAALATMVKAARAGTLEMSCGRDFHASQLAGMTRALNDGLGRLAARVSKPLTGRATAGELPSVALVDGYGS